MSYLYQNFHWFSKTINKIYLIIVNDEYSKVNVLNKNIKRFKISSQIQKKRDKNPFQSQSQGNKNDYMKISNTNKASQSESDKNDDFDNTKTK